MSLKGPLPEISVVGSVVHVLVDEVGGGPALQRQKGLENECFSHNILSFCASYVCVMFEIKNPNGIITKFAEIIENQVEEVNKLYANQLEIV